MDICRFGVIKPTCQSNYVITAVKVQRMYPGNCGCFRQDTEAFLYEKCLGNLFCTISYEDLQVNTNLFTPPPTEFCWFNYRIVYICEPGKSNVFNCYYILQTQEKQAQVFVCSMLMSGTRIQTKNKTALIPKAAHVRK